MIELRRRIQADPASIAFAQLAEECRRLGSNEEAVGICRAGLARHPGYFSARVTLGRALIELGQLDAAKAELDIVVAGVPDNLAAIRGLAEILQRRGQMTEALHYYKRALDLAKHDPDLEDTVERISQAVAPAPPPPAGPQASIEEIFNFDKLIDQLGLPREEPQPSTSASAAEEQSTSEGGPPFEDFRKDPPLDIECPSAGVESPAREGGPDGSLEDFHAEIPSASAAEGGSGETSPKPVEEQSSEGEAETPVVKGVFEAVELTLDDADSLAVMERELRELEQQRAQDEQRARVELADRRGAALIVALETWLSAIVADRERHTA